MKLFHPNSRGIIYFFVCMFFYVLQLEFSSCKESINLQVHVPPSCMLDGVHSQHFFGTGVIIYHSETMGLAAVDRNTVAVSVSDVMLSFAAFPMEIPGEVFALILYISFTYK